MLRRLRTSPSALRMPRSEVKGLRLPLKTASFLEGLVLTGGTYFAVFARKQNKGRFDPCNPHFTDNIRSSFLGHPLRGMLFCRGVFARKNAEIPLYHTAALFVKRKFAQILNQKNPKICATFRYCKPLHHLL